VQKQVDRNDGGVDSQVFAVVNLTRDLQYNIYSVPELDLYNKAKQTRSSADADNALDANEAVIRVIRGVPNFRKSIT